MKVLKCNHNSTFHALCQEQQRSSATWDSCEITGTCESWPSIKCQEPHWNHGLNSKDIDMPENQPGMTSPAIRWSYRRSPKIYMVPSTWKWTMKLNKCDPVSGGEKKTKNFFLILNNPVKHTFQLTVRAYYSWNSGGGLLQHPVALQPDLKNHKYIIRTSKKNKTDYFVQFHWIRDRIGSREEGLFFF